MALACATATAPGPEVRPARPGLVAEAENPTPMLTATPAPAELLMVALKRNPRILAARERAKALAEGPAIDGWLPNPRVMLGWYAVPVETRLGPQEWSLGIQQDIPFPTKLALKSDLAEVEARRARVVYERTVRDVLTDVVRTAWELVYLDEAERISGEISKLLDRYVAAAAGGPSDSPLSELFRAETQRAQLENDRILLIELHAAEAAKLRSLLDLPPGAPIGTPRAPAIPELSIGYEDVLAVANARSQELQEAGLALQAAELGSDLADQRRIPDLSLGVVRIFTGRLDSDLGANPPDNGQDPVIVTAGVSLPIWFQRDSAAIRRAEALERAAAHDRADVAARLRARLARAWYRLGNSDRLERLYAEVLVPRAQVAARTAEDLEASGKGTLAGTLETIAVLHNFRLAAARARADHGQALADLEAVVGRPFDVPDEGGAK